MFKHLQLPPLSKIKETVINGKRHYITEDGVILPSVTTILSYQPKTEVDAWRKRVGETKAKQVLHKATTRGNGLHFLIDQYLNNETEFPGAMPDALEMLYALKPHLNNINNIRYLEVPLYSTLIGMAGRADCIASYNDIPSIVDFKQARKSRTEAMVHNYFIQCTAYALLYTDMTNVKVTQGVILMAIEDNQPQVFVFDIRKYIPDLVKAIQIYKNSVDVKN